MDISVIIPVYNVERYLRYCLDSVLCQDFDGEYEIICINDGSTDGSCQILLEYGKRDSRVIVIEQENRGLSSARNEGLRKAQGKYVMFLDSDDYLYSKRVLQLMYDEAEQEALDFVVGDFLCDYGDESKNRRNRGGTWGQNVVVKGRDAYDRGFRTTPLMSVVWNKLYNRAFLLNNNLFFEEGIFYEDMAFTPRVYYLANRVKYIEEIVVAYRQREGSITQSMDTGRINDYFAVADSLRAFNNAFNSPALLRTELYIYVKIIHSMKHLDAGAEKTKCRMQLQERGVPFRFLHSGSAKYVLFGIAYLLGVV